MRLILFVSLLILTACSYQKSGQGAEDYLLPWADGNGQFHLQTVRISTMNAGNEVAGPAANVYVEPSFTDTGVRGSVAKARVMVSGGVKIPMDTESAMALAVYANMERIRAFENRVLGSTRIPWPRNVAIEMALIDADSGALERNNARYYGDQDAVAVFPYSANGLPMAVNTAILAHEHFHSHFHVNVIKAIPKRPHKDVSKMDFSEPYDYNSMVIRAWNEGLADFYAAVYTGAPNMMAASLGDLKGPDARDVDGNFTGFLNHSNFKAQLMRGQKADVEGRGDWCESTVCAYRQGTQMARWLYQFSGRDPQGVLDKVVANLPKLAALAQSAMNERFMDISEATAILTQDVERGSQ